MTDKLSDLSHEVHILELELRKLELLPEIARLESEQGIGDGCVGCAGPCETLQKYHDECEETLRLERVDRSAEINVLGREYHKALQYKDHVIDQLRQELEATKGFEKSDCELRVKVVELHTEIQGLEDKIKSIRNSWRLSCDDVQALQVELAARKGDSEVLMKVVDVVRNWDDGRTIPVPHKIVDLLVDYLEAPEPSEKLHDSVAYIGILELP